MTVNTVNVTSGPYVGNGVADEFDYNFTIKNKIQLLVYQTDNADAQTLLALDSDYTVNGVGDENGGSITLIAGALTSGYQLYIRSNYAATQETEFNSQGAFYPQLHESAMDKMTYLIQQLNDRVGRCIKIPDSDITGEFSPETYSLLGWNGGPYLVNYPISQFYGGDFVGVIPLPTFASLAATPATIGQIVNVVCHTAGTVLGGGDFIGVDDAGLTPDNGVISTSATPGVYWQRKGATPAYVNVEWFGINGANSGIPPDETAAIQTLLSSAIIVGIVFGSKRYGATYLTHIVAKDFIVGTKFTLFYALAGTPTRCLFDLRLGNGLHMSGIKLLGAQNQNYTCGMHWYTNDLTAYYPGKADIDIEIGEFLIGLAVGMLPSQTTYHAQGTVQAVGIATDAPISENKTVFKIQDCPKALHFNQPNGKLLFLNSYLEATAQSWDILTRPSQDTYCAFELERFGELSFVSSHIENITSSTGSLYIQNGGNVFIESCIVETSSPIRIKGNYFSSRLSKMVNLGYNNNTKPFFLLQSDATGSVDIDNSMITFPYNNMLGGDAYLAKGCSDIATEAYAEAPNVVVNLNQVELRDSKGGTGQAWEMIALGVKVKGNFRLTSFDNVSLEVINRTVNAKLTTETENVLADIIDLSSAEVSTYPTTVGGTSGGWTFATPGGAINYGSQAPSATLNVESLNGAVQTPSFSLRMNAVGSMTATTPSFGLSPFSYIFVTGWVKVLSGAGAPFAIKLETRNFADSSTLSTLNIQSGSGNLLPSTWVPFSGWAQQPAGAAKARIVLYVENGIDVEWHIEAAYINK